MFRQSDRNSSIASLVAGCVAAGLLAGCTSMLVGGTGSPAGRPIGTDSRNTTTIDRDNEISARIRSHFRADADLRPASLSVETRRGRVTLRGEIGAFELRDRAMRLASDVPGVTSVSNQITVRP